jgi:hypothetical protein
MTKGAIYAMYFKQGGEVANMATDNMTEEAIGPAQKQVKMQAHSQFGHAHKDAFAWVSPLHLAPWDPVKDAV